MYLVYSKYIHHRTHKRFVGMYDDKSNALNCIKSHYINNVKSDDYNDSYLGNFYRIINVEKNTEFNIDVFSVKRTKDLDIKIPNTLENLNKEIRNCKIEDII